MSLVANVSSAVVDIPKPVLPAGPVSSLTAARAYEILEERDTQIRKSKCLSVCLSVVCILGCIEGQILTFKDSSTKFITRSKMAKNLQITILSIILNLYHIQYSDTQQEANAIIFIINNWR